MRVFTLFLALFAIVGSIQAQHKLIGQVVDKQKKAISGAVVMIAELNKAAETTIDGNFLFENLSTGNFTLRIYSAGYKNWESSVHVDGAVKLTIEMEEQLTNLEEVVVSAVRAQYNSPTTFTQLSKKELKSISPVQDAPFLLAQEPSVVVTSDAGTGIGYTDFRIRGIDSKNTNVTINGVPVNDAESHGVYWVDIPDIASSVQSIQVQRGVGTSTNGAGAFGSSINLNTDNVSDSAFVEYNNAFGSFNTLKNTLHVASGKFRKNYFFEAKVGALKSDGYRDRSWSNLQNYFAQTGFMNEKTLIKLIAFGGREETYQAWWGIDSASMKDPQMGRKYNYNGAIYNNDGSISYYNNQVDHYGQDYLQLHTVYKFSDQLKFNAALHYTFGKGYYEEYVQGQNMSFYGLQPIALNDTTLNTTDLIRRLWLKNHFYGGIWGLNYELEKLSITWGGGFNAYDPGDHFGTVIWSQYFPNGQPGIEFYRNTSKKYDFNMFAKVSYQLTRQLLAFGDYQIRTINYSGNGYNKEYDDNKIDFKRNYVFHNPKVGLIYQIIPTTSVYSSFAVAHREPTRSDIIESPQGSDTKAEVLYDLELGVRHKQQNVFGELVFYNMQYSNQLVATGQLNDEGSYLRVNAQSSYRRGIELILAYKLSHIIRFDANAAISENKIKDFYQNINDSTFEHHKNITTAFSPSINAGGKITLTPFKNFESQLIFRHIGRQYLDNTETKIYSIDPYSLLDLSVSYSIGLKQYGIINIMGKVNNLLNAEYNSNGSVSGGVAYFYPQAGRNFIVGLSYRF